jgi:two-component system, sensor histidine kinase and response regulator
MSWSILIADDEPAIRRVLKRGLERGDISVDTVPSGSEALEAVSRGNYSLVLLDGEMPGMSGTEVARAIRRLGGARARVPLIALTGDGSAVYRLSLTEAGFDACLVKPVPLGEIRALVETWRRDPRSRGATSEAPEAAGEGPPSEPPLDPRVMLDICDGNRAVFDELMNGVLRDGARGLAELRVAAQERDCAAIRRIAHRMKGMTAMVGANRLSKLAAGIEGGGVAPEPSVIDALVDEFREVERQMRAVATTL